MSTEVTDTDVATRALRRVTLGDQTYRVPRTPTIAYLFWMRGFLQKFGTPDLTDDDLFDCYDQTVAFLRRYNKDVDEEKLQASCELIDLVNFYNRCFGADVEDEGDERPPRRPRGTSGPSRTAKRSRS